MIGTSLYRNAQGTPRGLCRKQMYPCRIVRAPKSNMRSRAFLGLDIDTLTSESYLIGKSIIYFSIFYCSLNWIMYRRIRKDYEERNKQDGNDKER